jgi:hypothetical protein
MPTKKILKNKLVFNMQVSKKIQWAKIAWLNQDYLEF